MKINAGHYYKKENVTLYHHDSLELLKKIPDNSIDMIFADPPYHLSNGGITVQSGKMVNVNKADWDVSNGAEEDFAFHHAWITESRRVLKLNGTIWISGTYHSIYHCGHSLKLNDYKILNEIVWFKPNAAPNISCRYFTASHETLLWATTSEKSKHIFHYHDMRNGDWPEDKLKTPDKQMRSVWSIPPPGKKEKEHGKHPTQKPEKLLKRVISACTHPGDIILDPFTGSSTTGVVAKKLDRTFVGIDNSKDYLDLSIKRLKAA